MPKTPIPILLEARDPATAPQRLTELARESVTLRRAVAGNPNTPTPWLLWLAKSYWRELLDNPVLPLLLLEDPGFPAKLPTPALRAMLRRPDPPPEFLTLLARHPDAEIRESARLHRAHPNNAGHDEQTDLAPQLVIGGGAAMAEMLALELAPPWIILQALEGADASLRARAVEQAEQAADSNSVLRVRHKLLRRAGANRTLRHISKRYQKADLAPDELHQLARGGPFARRLAARHPNTAPADLALLAELHQEATTRHSVAANAATPLATLVSLAATGDAKIRRAVAGNKSASAALLDRLAGDAQSEVRVAVARNRGAALGALARLASDAEPKVRRAVAQHRGCDETSLRALAKDAEPKVRRAIAKRRDCPLDALRELLSDADHSTSYNAASNNAWPTPRRLRLRRYYADDSAYNQPKTELAHTVPAPASALEIEAEHLVMLLREDNPAPEIFERALACADTNVRRMAARHKAMPVAWIENLLGDPDTFVRCGVASNATLPIETRLKLWDDPETQVRSSLLSAEELPLEFYEKAAADPDEELRARLTYCQRAPVELLVRVARDDTSVKVLESLCSRHNGIMPEPVLLALLDRVAEFPTLLANMSRNTQLSRAVLERLIPIWEWHHRTGLLQHQTYGIEHVKRMKQYNMPCEYPVAVPPDLQIAMLDVPEPVKYMRGHVAKVLLEYWAVTPEVVEVIGREALDEQAALQKRGLLRRLNRGGLLLRVARHSLTPPAMLAELAANYHSGVRLAAIENPRTPPETPRARHDVTLHNATKRTGQTARLCALSHPDAAPQTLEKFAAKGRWGEHYAVARNAGAPRELLETLCDDANLAVAGAARATLDAALRASE